MMLGSQCSSCCGDECDLRHVEIFGAENLPVAKSAWLPAWINGRHRLLEAPIWQDPLQCARLMYGNSFGRAGSGRVGCRYAVVTQTSIPRNVLSLDFGRNRSTQASMVMASGHVDVWFHRNSDSEDFRCYLPNYPPGDKTTPFDVTGATEIPGVGARSATNYDIDFFDSTADPTFQPSIFGGYCDQTQPRLHRYRIQSEFYDGYDGHLRVRDFILEGNIYSDDTLRLGTQSIAPSPPPGLVDMYSGVQVLNRLKIYIQAGRYVGQEATAYPTDLALSSDGYAAGQGEINLLLYPGGVTNPEPDNPWKTCNHSQGYCREVLKFTFENITNPLP